MEARMAKVEAAVESIVRHYATAEALARLEGKIDVMDANLTGKIDTQGVRIDGIEHRLGHVEKLLYAVFVGVVVTLIKLFMH